MASLLLLACEAGQTAPNDRADHCAGKCDAIGVSGSLPVAIQSATWDGRVVIGAADSGECRVMAVRPGRIDRTGGGLTFPPSVFSEGLPCPTALSAHALAAATELTDNPSASNANGAPLRGGDHRAYALTIVSADEDRQLGSREATIVVANPGTDDAEVVLADWGDPSLLTADGEPLVGTEPTLTADGGLLVYQIDGEDSLVYARRDGDAWTEPASVTELFTEGGVVVDGLTLAERYPLAQRQLRGPDGRFLPPGSEYRGAHPWLSQDAAELFHTSTIAGNPEREGERGRHGAVTVVGQATGHGMRHVDGRINPTREGMTESISVAQLNLSPGRLFGAFTPYFAEKTLPTRRDVPTYPMFGRVEAGDDVVSSYTEVDFEIFADADYLVYLPMNENIETQGDFTIDTSRTPDISGHFNTATLNEGARFAVEEFGTDESTGFPVQDDNSGAIGRALYFSDDGSATIVDGTMPVPRWGMSFGMQIQRLEAAPGSRPLLQWPGVARMDLGEDGRVAMTVVVGGVENTATTSGAVPLHAWTHVGFTYDGRRGELRMYVDGSPSGIATFDRGMPLSATGDPVVGPAGGAESSQGDTTVYALDEVSVSQIVRFPDEMYRAATGEAPPRPPTGGEELLLGAALPVGIDSAEFQIPPWAALRPEVVELGQLIFFDTRLSRNGQVSCATCHDPEFAFTDGRAVALAIDGTDLPRATPTVFNRALSTRQFWDSRSPSVESQALSPIGSPLEMGFTIEEAVDLLRSSPEYVERFQQAFGRLPDRNGIANAIATFERAQFAGDSRVDLYEAGDLDQLTASEERGRALFHGEARCATCHGGSNYSDEQLHNIGLIGGNDLGGFFTSGGRNKNARAFKTPTLRNIDVTGPYFHNGSVETLEEVVALYNAGPTVAGADWEARALGLTADEETDLVAFLRALTSPNATTPMDVELPEIPE